ncbi:MAG: cyclopropane-fatty-acyl-phospholipid synthase family protein [Oleiphilaceae bacterium]|nr:cyclopropane-fatty-acyl-phospholipid synthase family protein [Oleiphilaceae bacterium]
MAIKENRQSLSGETHDESVSRIAASRSNPFLPRSQPQTPAGSPLPPERWMAEKFLSLAGNPPLALNLWDREEARPDNSPVHYTLRVSDRAALYELMSKPNLAFGDLYSTGRLQISGHLPDFLYALYHSTNKAHASLPKWLQMLWRDQKPRATGLKEARSNIHHHYDLGNDFYKLWLDRDHMQYTCAYYESPDMTLEQAQRAKLELVCRKLHLRPGQSVVEAGCGWGGLARYMAREYGVKVRAFNISQEQVSYAREQAAREGLQDRVEYVLDDYRNISGECDAFVSVGMLEHVGTENYPTLAALIKRHLSRDGLALIHTIGRNQPALINAWIEKRIFPGAYPPSITELTALAESGPFSVLDIENLRLHYASTLEHWLERFEASADQVREFHDENFVRAWRLYLAGSIAAFRTSNLQLFQMVMAHPENNRIPRHRQPLFDPNTREYF